MAELFEPASLGPLTLRNRIIKSATFEGRSRDGLPLPELANFHRRVAAGGVGMSTVAYLAVSPEGRTDSSNVLLRPEAVEGLRAVTHAIHDEGALAAAQIGHAGPVANAASNKARSITPSRMFSPLGLRWSRAATEHDLDRIEDDYRRGARIALQAGFDAIEIHLGHNYLLSAFLSPLLNRRQDQYAGSIENRARYPRRIVAAVRESVGPGVAVTAKLNMTDGVRGGLTVDDSLAFARMLDGDGHLDALELTGGSSLANPMFLFRGAAPYREFAETLPWYLRLGFRLVGKKFLREYPYEEAYFQQTADRYRQQLHTPVILLGGISRLDTAKAAIDAGFSFVAMGRALLHDPDLVNQWEQGTATESGCIHCNRCMPTIYTGTRCPLVEPHPGDRPIPGAPLATGTR